MKQPSSESRQGLSGGYTGRWLFRNRGWLPVPLLLVMLISLPRFWGPGLLIIALGEALRLWAVGHIGRPSRTRGDDVSRLIDSGPYARARNPLYIGNLLIFAGLGTILWPWVFVTVPLLALYYDRIVRWEEQNLGLQLGAPYLDYQTRVSRWGFGGSASPSAGQWNAREALRSERSTLLALTVILGGVVLRGWLGS